jgi:hypothetical protein
MMRKCGDCTLCCKLLAVPPLDKVAGERCKYQRHSKGCTVYHTRKMPRACGFWNCRWLVGDDTADQSRPDRSHIVIDIMPDFITLSYDNQGEPFKLQVVQAWIDPNFPDAHRDPAFRAYVLRRGLEGIATMIRSNGKDSMVLFPPNMATDNEWHEITSGKSEHDHTFTDIQNALGQVNIVLEDGAQEGTPDGSGRHDAFDQFGIQIMGR